MARYLGWEDSLEKVNTYVVDFMVNVYYRGADKSLARTGRKQATATEGFDVHVSYLQS